MNSPIRTNYSKQVKCTQIHTIKILLFSTEVSVFPTEIIRINSSKVPCLVGYNVAVYSNSYSSELTLTRNCFPEKLNEKYI